MLKKVDKMNDDQLVTISIRLFTRKRLKSFGTIGDTYDSFINKLLDMAEGKHYDRVQAKPQSQASPTSAEQGAKQSKADKDESLKEAINEAIDNGPEGHVRADELGGDLYTTWEGREDD